MCPKGKHTHFNGHALREYALVVVDLRQALSENHMLRKGKQALLH